MEKTTQKDPRWPAGSKPVRSCCEAPVMGTHGNRSEVSNHPERAGVDTGAGLYMNQAEATFDNLLKARVNR